MIDFIKYTIDGVTYSLTNNGDGTWVRDERAPSVAGNYLLTFTISENGIITTVDSSSSLYEAYLKVIVETERVTFLENYVPDFMSDTEQFIAIFEIEDEDFDDFHAAVETVKSDMFITTSSNKAITRREDFLNIVGIGTLEQRKSYLISLNQKGNKLSKTTIENIVKAITGSGCIATFFGPDETDNPAPGYGYLSVQVLSPDNTKDYRYDDILRTLNPLIPSHIKLGVMKYFATWRDISDNFADWSAVAASSDWQAIKDFIPPQ